MRHWMDRRGLTQEKLECFVTELAEIAALRDRVTAGQVESYFAAHRCEFDTVSLAQFAVADADRALGIADQIRSGLTDFYSAAEQSFQAGASTTVFTTMRYGQAPPELQAAFTAMPGVVLGPIVREEGCVIVRVLAHAPAQLDEQTRAVIKDLLFDEWLEKRRQSSTIEWYWGNSGQSKQ